MNKVILIGRIAKDLELKHTGNGLAVCSFSLAVNKPYKSGGNAGNQADFFNCIAWRGTAENLCKYQKKGSLISVEGNLINNSWEDNNGVKRYKTEVNVSTIEYLGGKKEAEADFRDDPYAYMEAEAKLPDYDINNDDIPF